jgi:bacterioferritin-associated ferredoxin
MLDIQRSRVPIYWRHSVLGARGLDRVEQVTIGPTDKTGAPIAGVEVSLEADSLVVGHGLVPGAEIPRLLRASMSYDRLRGGWIPALDSFGRTSISGFYSAGDGAGVRGAEPAALSGELTGLTVALEAGRIDAHAHASETARLARALGRYQPFADKVAELMALRSAHVGAIRGDTVVCRCEDVTRAALDRAASDGAADVNQLKHFTRCGMGPCQGRMCGDVAAELLARARGVSREAVGFWTGRSPLRPVPLADLVGTFSYSDIPIPKPAPL